MKKIVKISIMSGLFFGWLNTYVMYHIILFLTNEFERIGNTVLVIKGPFVYLHALIFITTLRREFVEIKPNPLTRMRGVGVGRAVFFTGWGALRGCCI